MRKKGMSYFHDKPQREFVESKSIFDMGGVEKIQIIGPDPVSLERIPQGLEILSGNHVFSNRRGSFNSHSETTFLFGPNDPYEFHHHKNSQTSCFTLSIDPDFISNLFNEFDIQGEKVEFEKVESQFHPKVISNLKKITYLTHLNKMGKENYDLLFSEMILSLFPFYKNNVERKVKRNLPTKKYKADIKKSQKIIKEVIYYSPLHFERFENFTQMNKFHFIKNFEKVAGRSLLSFLNQLKLSYAKEKLIHSNLTLKEIAINLGFGELEVFKHFFKQRVGIGPSEYRSYLTKNRTLKKEAA